MSQVAELQARKAEERIQQLQDLSKQATLALTKKYKDQLKTLSEQVEDQKAMLNEDDGTASVSLVSTCCDRPDPHRVRCLPAPDAIEQLRKQIALLEAGNDPSKVSAQLPKIRTSPSDSLSFRADRDALCAQ